MIISRLKIEQQTKKLLGLLALILVVNALLSSILLQFNNKYRLNLAGDGIQYESFNFYPLTIVDDPTMTPFKWCYHKSGIVFRGVARGTDYNLRLYIRARNDSPEGKYLRVHIADTKIFEGNTDLDWRWYEMKVPASLIKSDNILVLIYTKPQIIGKDTVRGLRVSRAELAIDKNHGFLVPSFSHIFNTTFFLILVFLILLVVQSKLRIILIIETFAILLINCLLLTHLKDPLIRGTGWLNINLILVLVVTLIIKFLLPFVVKSAKLPYVKGDNDKAAFFSAASLIIKSGLWFIPFTSSIDLIFHVHMMEKIFAGDFLNMSKAGDYRFPYPPAFYMLFEPFKSLTNDNLLLIKIGFAFLMAFIPILIYLIALKLFKDRRAALYALILAVVMPKDFYIYMLGIISNGFGHFMMLLSITLTILLYDRIREMKTGFLLFVVYTLTALSHFGAMISFILLMVFFFIFQFIYEAMHPVKLKSIKVTKIRANPILFRGSSPRMLTLLICALATAFFFYYIRLINPTLKNIAAMLLADEASTQTKGLLWFSSHNMLKFLQNIILKFGFLPFIAGIAAIILRMKQKPKITSDMLIFGWCTAFMIQWWLAMKESLMLRFELFAVPLFAITAGWLFSKMKKDIYFKATAVFCLMLSIYLMIIFYSDIQRIGSIIIPHKTLKWILW